MKRRRLSPKSLKARIDTLTRRHREIDLRITREQSQPTGDALRLKQLKQERLGLRDAIRLTQTLLKRLDPRPVRLAGQQQFHSG
ncbi:hypothetical protein XM53_03260 [Roseovarius atlanticus]|uniref:DUF465 domain-containing protein n=1 Tax=Roseovarius atlanticus TaxID=1641875 RepID=A0A0T5P0W8_9RHOB|nr:YdcH family protein [Roseovarius atlanticus]KRS14726.1 hypothetical protein XM53_03260 [Roseovarius atlanticus]